MSKTSSQSSPAKIIPRTVSDSFVAMQNPLVVHKTKSLDKERKEKRNHRYKEGNTVDHNMARTSSRAEEDVLHPTVPYDVNANQILQEEPFHLSSEESENVDGVSSEKDFPPPPLDLPVIKTEPEPNIGKVECRTPSPVKMRLAPPPPYEQINGKNAGMPAGYLHTVVATYSYVAADDDELSFSKSEHILVVKHPQPEEQVKFNL
jgi:hypothetical protein